MSLQGRTVLVTGASSGIGEAIARAAHSRGAGRLVLVARRADRLQTLAAALGPNAAAHPDVDVVVNAAGFGARGPLTSHEPARMTALVTLNCTALVDLSRAWLPRMLDQSFGGILNVGSMVGFLPVPSSAAYAASKAFVHSFTEALHVEVHGSGVCVHLVAPGPVPTEFFTVSRGAPREGRSPLSVSAASVAEQALSDLLANRAVRVPGLPVRLITAAASSLPAPLRRRLTRLIR